MEEDSDLVDGDGIDTEESDSDSQTNAEVVNVLHPEENACSSPSEKSSSPEPEEPPVAGAELNDICRNSEGLQFIDHVTEIKPGKSLNCYDELIYGASVAAPIHESEVEASTDYQHWQSISPEELFQATSFETEFFNDTSGDRNLRRRKQRTFDSK